MTLNFGWNPQEVHVLLSTSQDFIFEIEPTDPSAIPDGTTVVMNIYAPGTDRLLPSAWQTPVDIWAATVAGGVVSWDIDSARADVIPNMAFFRIIISYSDAVYVWAKGSVIRDD